MAGLPDFPATLPANTVVGNLSSQPRVAGAIPIAALSSQLADASTINFLPSGASAVARTVQSKLRDIVALADYSTRDNFNAVIATGAAYIPAIRNAIINGAMEIAQRGTSIAISGANAYTLDRWQWRMTGTMAYTVTQDSDVPTVAQAGVLFTNSLRFNLTTPEDSLAANDSSQIVQFVEGYNWRSLAQRPCVLSFWVKATLVGSYSVSLRNSGTDKSFVSPFVINSSNTWEQKTIAVPASPSSGTWSYTTGIGCTVDICLAAGSGNALSDPTNLTWQSFDYMATTNQVNGVQTGATDFRITGVQLEPGLVATPFQIRSFQEELLLCKRYFRKSFIYATTPAQNVGANTGERQVAAIRNGATSNSHMIQFDQSMRVAPTVTLYNPQVANAQVRDIDGGLDCSASAANSRTENGFRVDFTGNAGTTIANNCGVHWAATAEY